jgi:hypothetical protein
MKLKIGEKQSPRQTARRAKLDAQTQQTHRGEQEAVTEGVKEVLVALKRYHGS